MIQSEEKKREAFFRSLMFWEHVASERCDSVFTDDTDTDSYIDAFFSNARIGDE